MKKENFNLDNIPLEEFTGTFVTDLDVIAFYEYLLRETEDKFKEFDAARIKSAGLARSRRIG